VPFSHRVFNSHHTTSLHSPSPPTDAVSSDITGSGVSQLSDAQASDFSQHNQSVSVFSESIQPAVAQHHISLPETGTSIPNQLDWSVDFNSDVKPALNVKLEHLLTPGTIVAHLKFSPDGKYLAVGVDNGRTCIYDLKTMAKSWSVTFMLVWRNVD